MKAVIDGMLPPANDREMVTNSPKTTANAQVLIPESEYVKSFSGIADGVAAGEGTDIGERNKIMRGVTTKDESYATLQVVNAGEAKAASTDLKIEEFLLIASQESSQEKYQLIETFGETVAFLFGERPKIYNYSGTLLNTDDYAWKNA